MTTRWKVFAVLAVAAVLLGVAGGISNWFQPREKRTEVAQTRKVEARQEQTLQASTKTEQHSEASRGARASRARTQRKDVSVRITERTEKYALRPAANPVEPSVTIRPILTEQRKKALKTMGDVPEPPALKPELVEVTTRVTETVDKSTTESTAAKESSSSAAAASATSTDTKSASSETVKVEEATKTVTTVEKLAEKRDDPGRLGVAVTSDLRPGITFDLVRGPRLFDLNRLGAGVIVTGPRFSNFDAGLDDVDAGPQVNYAISRSSYVGLGHTVRHSRTFVFAGLRF